MEKGVKEKKQKTLDDTVVNKNWMVDNLSDPKQSVKVIYRFICK